MHIDEDGSLNGTVSGHADRMSRRLGTRGGQRAGVIRSIDTHGQARIAYVLDRWRLALTDRLRH